MAIKCINPVKMTLLNDDINTGNDNGCAVDEQNSSPLGEIKESGVSNLRWT